VQICDLLVSSFLNKVATKIRSWAVAHFCPLDKEALPSLSVKIGGVAVFQIINARLSLELTLITVCFVPKHLLLVVILPHSTLWY
jgi:hypothetical protein